MKALNSSYVVLDQGQAGGARVVSCQSILVKDQSTVTYVYTLTNSGFQDPLVFLIRDHVH